MSNWINRHTGLLRLRSPMLLAVGVVLFLLTATSTGIVAQDTFQPSVTLAQLTPFVDGGGSTPKESFGLNRELAYKIAGVVGCSLIVFFLSWFALYPALLRRGKSWPVTLYGRCTGFAWLTSWLMALGVLYYDLPLADGDTFWNKHGLRLVFLAVAVVLGGACLFIWHSDSQASQK